jgi:phosphatidylglycerophosphatase A
MTELKNQDTPACKGIMRDPVHWLAFGFGSGCSPRAPGTMGTLVAIPVYLLMADLLLWKYLLVTALMFIVGIWLCGKTAEKLGVHDHGGIVWDEIVGYLITMIAAPQGWVWLLIGFILFRFFDILKPWPISIADKKLTGGFGIMVDDVLAGMAAFFVLHIIAYYSIVL